MPEWTDFNACLRERLDSCQLQLALIDQIYDYVLKRDPYNVARRKTVLALQQMTADNIAHLVGLMAKYQTARKDQSLSPEIYPTYQLN